MNTAKLRALGARCRALEWVALQSSPKQAWRDCPRGDWMLWLVFRLSGESESPERSKAVLCLRECVRLTLQYVPEGENHPRTAIETAERWARGEATIGEVGVAAVRAAGAVWAAETAAKAADAAVWAADAAAWAANAANAADAAAEAASLRASAEIVRRHYPEPPRLP